MKLKLNSYWPGVVWFLLSSVAFFLPGAALPDDPWFNILEIDKIVHIALFVVMVVLWSLPLIHRLPGSAATATRLIRIPLLFFGYSILVEFIQHYFIPGRSFDLADILADAVGCVIGFFWMRKYHRSLPVAE